MTQNEFVTELFLELCGINSNKKKRPSSKNPFTCSVTSVQKLLYSNCIQIISEREIEQFRLKVCKIGQFHSEFIQLPNDSRNNEKEKAKIYQPLEMAK